MSEVGKYLQVNTAAPAYRRYYMHPLRNTNI